VRRAGTALLLAVALVAAGCGGASVTATPTTLPLPAGPTPSPIATMVCQPKVSDEIHQVLGVKADVVDESWTVADHTYRCTYRYPDGSMGLSVAEVSSWDGVENAYASLQHSLGVAQELPNLGQAAFQAPDGSVVVRKDWKILVVDPTGLPAQFGVPPTSSADVAVTVADVVLGCWSGD
jgi:hypothetical protein